MQNTVTKKRVPREDMDSEYLFDSACPLTQSLHHRVELKGKPTENRTLVEYKRPIRPDGREPYGLSTVFHRTAKYNGNIHSLLVAMLGVSVRSPKPTLVLIKRFPGNGNFSILRSYDFSAEKFAARRLSLSRSKITGFGRQRHWTLAGKQPRSCK